MATVEDTSELLLDTFVQLSDTLARGYEIGDLLQFLVDRCRELLRVDTAGVLLESAAGTLGLAAATSQAMLDIEDLEISLEQGPCLDAYRSGEQILVADLKEFHDRWPQFTPRILELGMRSACVFPLGMCSDRIGALNVYSGELKGFSDRQVRVGQALADIAAVGILQDRTVQKAERRSEQLQHALNSRVLIEQAKGVLAERYGVPPEEAFEELRRHARRNSRRLREVCQDLLAGNLDLDRS